MMQKTIMTLTLLGLLMAAGTGNARERPYFVDNRGQKIEVENISADDQGNLHLQMERGATRDIRRGDYRYAFIPKPERVAALENLFNRGEYARFLANAQAVFNNYRYLGWGGMIAYWQGQAELQRDNPELARDAFERASRFAINNQQREQIDIGRINTYLALRQDQEAANLLQDLKISNNPRNAAFSFFAKGQLLARQGAQEEAILELLKTVLLFDPKEEEVAKIREDAKEYLLELLRDRQDPAYQRVREIN